MPLGMDQGRLYARPLGSRWVHRYEPLPLLQVTVASTITPRNPFPDSGSIRTHISVAPSRGAAALRATTGLQLPTNFRERR